jgi:hypothetical protein
MVPPYMRMSGADRALVQDQLKILYSIVQERDCLACHVCGKSVMARIRILSNLTFNDGLQQVFRQQKPKANVTHLKQCAVLIVAIMKDRGL